MPKLDRFERATALVKRHTGLEPQAGEHGRRFVVFKNHVLTWGSRDAHVRHENDHDGINDDYFAGRHFRTIEKALKSLLETETVSVSVGLPGFARAPRGNVLADCVAAEVRSGFRKGGGFVPAGVVRLLRTDIYLRGLRAGLKLKGALSGEVRCDLTCPVGRGMVADLLEDQSVFPILRDWLIDNHDEAAALLNQGPFGLPADFVSAIWSHARTVPPPITPEERAAEVANQASAARWSHPTSFYEPLRTELFEGFQLLKRLDTARFGADFRDLTNLLFAMRLELAAEKEGAAA